MCHPEKFEPRYEKEISEEELEKQRFLEFEKLTQPSDDIKKFAEGLRNLGERQRIEKILSFFGQKENLEHVNLEEKNKKEWKKFFNKRSAAEIFESKTSYGCTDTATLFVAMARECGIPAKFIEGKRLGKSGTHSWAQVFIEGKWVDIDPTQSSKGIEFKPEESEHGPYKIISESLGPSDSLISSYEEWRKIEKAWDYRKNDFKDKFKKEIEKILLERKLPSKRIPNEEKEEKRQWEETERLTEEDLEKTREELKKEFQKAENRGEGGEKEI